MRRVLVATVVCAIVFIPVLAGARETEHILPVQDATESDIGKAKLFSTPFYMKGQEHPTVAQSLGEVTTNQSTSGAFRSDEASCQIAFLSSIRELQKSAFEKGADAIVDVVSITWHERTESATKYRCVAGTFVAHVGLKGTLVKLAE
jgi:uncharacterized protein YbjQ (UPF0145 family)